MDSTLRTHVLKLLRGPRHVIFLEPAAGGKCFWTKLMDTVVFGASIFYPPPPPHGFGVSPHQNLPLHAPPPRIRNASPVHPSPFSHANALQPCSHPLFRMRATSRPCSHPFFRMRPLRGPVHTPFPHPKRLSALGSLAKKKTNTSKKLVKLKQTNSNFKSCAKLYKYIWVKELSWRHIIVLPKEPPEQFWC